MYFEPPRQPLSARRESVPQDAYLRKPLIDTHYGTINGVKAANSSVLYEEEASYHYVIKSNDLNSSSGSDQYPKTSAYLTTINIVKSFIGLGVLAAPSGY